MRKHGLSSRIKKREKNRRDQVMDWLIRLAQFIRAVWIAGRRASDPVLRAKLTADDQRRNSGAVTFGRTWR